MKDYSKNIIKEYEYWTLYVHENQSYLGRCYLWCKRENALDLTDATEEEQNELFKILPQIKSALEKAFQTDWFNYAFLGNEDRHLHGHIIPRYEFTREFAGIIFTDDRWGKNYLTNKDFITPPDVLESVRLEILRWL